MPTLCAIDFETFYSKEYSVKSLGPHAYCQDRRFDCYLVALVCELLPAGEWAGHPKEAPWHLVRNADIFVAHNVGFEAVVLERLMQIGVVPRFTVKEWVDTEDLASYLQAPKDLAGACRELLGVEVDKSFRASMEGETLCN